MVQFNRHKAVFLTLTIFLIGFNEVNAQFVSVKNGNDFLSSGIGARYMSLGGTGVSFSSDVIAPVWNPAGLAGLTTPQLSYMHSERFAGLVGFDYGAAAIPLEETGAVVGVSFFRQAVDDIKNTTNAWDRDRGLPYPDAADRFELFSASDMAFLVTYAKQGDISWGVNAKFLYSKIGAFANAWGYSLDVGVQKSEGPFRWGVALVDATTLSKFWTVNASAFQDRQENFDDIIPEGQNERTLPSLRSGISHQLEFGKFGLLVAADLDMRFEGREAFYMNTGAISYEPHLGFEVRAFNKLYLRGGLTNFLRENDENLTVSPTVGAGLEFKHLSFDYSFDNFQGVSSVLGNTHRISLIFRFANKKGT